MPTFVSPKIKAPDSLKRKSKNSSTPGTDFIAADTFSSISAPGLTSIKVKMALFKAVNPIFKINREITIVNTPST